jgi:hypothetical protein
MTTIKIWGDYTIYFVIDVPTLFSDLGLYEARFLFLLNRYFLRF